MATTFYPKLPDKVKEYVISSVLPNIEDTFLAKEDMGKLLARFATQNLVPYLKKSQIVVCCKQLLSPKLSPVLN
jgi:hypothetical protein